jgi:16S rRNA processing protein RimM
MVPGVGPAPPEDEPIELEVGRVGRAHGLTGEVRVDLWSEDSRLSPGSVLTTDRGPLTVAHSRPHQDRYLVQFEGVVDREGAELLCGLLLRAKPLERPGTLWVHELVGSAVVSVDGTELGRVEGVEANPASDLLVLDGGGLVPLRFVVSHEPGQRVIVDIPDGLLD